MQLYFRPNSVVQLNWLPREVVPSYLVPDNVEDLLITIELHQQISLSSRRRVDWVLVSGSEVSGLANNGSVKYTIPQRMGLQDCGDQNQLLCPVAFKLSATVPIPGGSNTVTVAIWSAVGYLQSDTATDNDLIELCEDWFTPEPPAMNSPNEITDSTLSILLMCPPTLAQAMADNRFRREVMESAFSSMSLGYPQAAMKFYYPAASVCYLEVITTRSEVIDRKK